MRNELDAWLPALVHDMHQQIVRAVRNDLATKSSAMLASEHRPGAGDVSFTIDVRPEEIVEESFAHAPEPVVVICEGLGRRVFPAVGSEAEARWTVIVDPLDGTREIAYGKRSAWVLTGVAPAFPTATLADIVWALQTEVPPLVQPMSVMLSAMRGASTTAKDWDLRTGTLTSRVSAPAPSKGRTVRGGFAVFADYFAGIHELTGRIADRVLSGVLGDVEAGQTLAFNDQYISTAGCLYLLVSGQYRFFADLRPVIWEATRGSAPGGLCAHPYDLCTVLLAERSGVIVTGLDGEPLGDVLSTDVDCGWIGYANEHIRSEVEPVLRRVLDEVRQA